MAFGQKDKSKLTQKVITDKTGKKTTVWVRPDGSESPAEKMKKEVTFTKDTYDPKNKHHWSRAVSDLANKVKNAKTDSEKKDELCRNALIKSESFDETKIENREKESRDNYFSGDSEWLSGKHMHEFLQRIDGQNDTLEHCIVDRSGKSTTAKWEF